MKINFCPKHQLNGFNILLAGFRRLSRKPQDTNATAHPNN